MYRFPVQARQSHTKKIIINLFLYTETDIIILMLKMSLFILLSIVLSLISMPIIIHFCNKYKLYDYHDARKVHSGNISRLGGVGIVTSFTIAAALYLIFTTQLSVTKSLPILIAGLIIFVFGLLDDILTLPALLKLKP